jgi:hypothetical protein
MNLAGIPKSAGKAVWAVLTVPRQNWLAGFDFGGIE